uniref:Uncharacterized protein n=1 Tax=Arundo donax TaxID=35708 RepID=A0A0A8ZVS5_ARUDO
MNLMRTSQYWIHTS